MKRVLCVLLSIAMIFSVISVPVSSMADPESQEQTTLAITSQPQDYVGNIGDTATFHVEAQGDGLTYQWQWHNGSVWADSSISGNKTATISTKITQTKLKYQYRCVITDQYGDTVTSEPARIIEYASTLLAIIAQPEDFEGCIGEMATFTVVAQGEGLIYQWQWFNGDEWADSGISGNTTPTVTTKITKTKLSYQYRCVITDQYGNTVISEPARIIEYVPVQLAITTQPTDFEGRIGDTAVFTVVAQGEGLTYQWQWFNGTSWANSGISGNKTATASTKITQAKLSYQYRCVIMDQNEDTVISNAVRMILRQPIEIIAQPEDFEGRIGDTAVFTVVAEGEGLTYQWQWFNGTEWADSGITGNKTATASTKITKTKLGYQYRCLIEDQYGNTILTDAVRMIEFIPPQLTIAAQPEDYEGRIGDTAVFTVVAEGDGLTYQWQWFNGSDWANSGITGNKTPTASTKITQSKLSYQYRCVIKDQYGNTVISNAVRMILEKDTYTITFDANGGSFDYYDPTDTTYQMEVSKTEPVCFYMGVMHSDPRMILDGWYYDAACTRLATLEGEDFLPGGDVTLYAKWIEGWLIAFESNGGDIFGWDSLVETDYFGVRKGQPIGYHPETLNSKYSEFEGWYLTADCTGESIDLDTFVPQSDMTLYAKWINPYKLTITIQPEDFEGRIGETATFYVEAVGEELIYQWQWYNGTEWADSGISGNKTNLASTKITETKLKYQYRCLIIDIATGECIYSDPVRIILWREEFTVTFDFNGGYLQQDPTLTYASAKFKRGSGFHYNYYSYAAQNDAHMALNGWYWDAACTQPLPFAEGYFYPSDDMTVYAGWTEGFSVTFDFNGGIYYEGNPTTSMTEFFAKGERINSSPIPYREGMALKGWYYDAACTESAEDIFYKTFDGDVILYAGWGEALTVTYDANGGYMFTEPEMMTYTWVILKGEQAGSVTVNHLDPTLTLEGWYYDAACTDKACDADGAFTPTEDVTVYAKWTRGYTVTFDPNGGNATYNEPRKILPGNTIGWAPQVWCDGMAFTGWYLDAECMGDRVEPYRFVPEDDVILYAGWDEAWTVTFDGNGGKVNGTSLYVIAVRKGDFCMNSGEAKWNGMAFAGWYLNPMGFGEAVDLWDYMPTEDVTFYAKWVPGWTVIFDANGGYFDFPAQTNIVKAFQDGGSFYWEEYAPTHPDGHMAFVGWFHDAACTEPIRLDDAYYYVHKNVTLYAKWEEGYIVTFDANGGYLDCWPYAASRNTIVRKGESTMGWVALQDGKAFAGWYLDAACTINANISYMYGSGYMPTGDVTLYAKWVDPDETAILFNPRDYWGAVGDWATFEVEAVGADLCWRWERFDGTAWSETVPPCSDPVFNLEITAESLNYQYRCVITDHGNSIASTAAGIIEYRPLWIVSQPRDFKGKINDTATFTVEADGIGLTYQWQWYDGTEWANSGISGNKTAAASTKITQGKLAYQYRCVITDRFGESIVTDPVCMILQQPIEITAQPKNFVGKIGDTATFTVVAEGESLTYQWQWHNGTDWANSGISGNKTPTASTKITESKLAYQYRCVISDDQGNSVISDAVRLQVDYITITFDANGGWFTSNGFTVMSFSLPCGMPLSWLTWDYSLDHPEGSRNKYPYNWYSNEECTGDPIDWAYIPVSDMTFYMKWEQPATFVLHANGGHMLFNGIVLDSIRSIAEIGYEDTETWSQEYLVTSDREFLGWYYEPECINLAIAPGGSYVMTEPEVHLYAKWAETPGHTVTFHANGGLISYRAFEEISFFVKEGDAIGFEVGVNREDEGLVFSGWNLATDGSGQTVDVYSYVPTEDVTLYAQWSEEQAGNKCIVTLDGNGGYFADDPNETAKVFYVEPNTVFRNYDQPVHGEGKVFLGWFRTPDGEGQIDDLYALLITQNIILYARWADSVTVTFDANGGWLFGDRNQTVFTRTVPQGSKVYNLGRVTNPNVHLALEGWYYDQACTQKAMGAGNSAGYIEPTSDVTLYAGWTQGYVITWNANGGTFMEDPTITVRKGDWINDVPAVNPPAGKMLVGWSEDPNARYSEYTFEWDGFCPTQNTTLYAVWTTEILTATFDANGGYLNDDVNLTRVDVDFSAYEDGAGELARGMRPEAHSFDGKAFVMWNTRPDGRGEELWEDWISSDTVYYAIWADTSAPVVTYDANGGYFNSYAQTRITESAQPCWDYNSSSISYYMLWLTDYVSHRDSHKVLKGWYYDAACTRLAGNKYQEIEVQQDVILYAGWADAWSVTLDGNGGTVNGRPQMTIAVVKGQKIDGDLYLDTANEGMKFDGWNLTADGSGHAVNLSSYKPSSDVILYAQWTPLSLHTITLDARGGFFYGNPGYTKLILHREDGYGVYVTDYDRNVTHSDPHLALKGWYLDAACTEPVEENYLYMYPGENMNVTVYAKWAPAYQVTMDANGLFFYGDSECTSVSFSVLKDNPISYDWWRLERSPKGYSFDGWYRNPSCMGDPVDLETYALTGDTVFYAGWVRRSVVTFDANGGCFGDDGAENTRTVWIRADKTVLEYFTDNYYAPYSEDIDLAFNGWFFDAACTRPVGAGFKATEDVTLYAGWTTDRYILTFRANGGCFYEGPACTVVNRAVRKGDVFLSETPSLDYREEAEFGGWYLDSACTDENRIEDIRAFAITGNITLYAKWIPVFIVTWEANGGLFWNNQESYQQRRLREGQSLSYTAVEPDYEGMVLVGWCLNADGSGEILGIREDFIVTGNMTFYAQWAEAWFVSFDLNGVAVNGWFGEIMNGKKVPKGSAVGESWQPISDNYSFAGWYLDADCTSDMVDVENYVPTADTVFYAKWQTKHTITFDANGGHFDSGKTVLQDKEVCFGNYNWGQQHPDPHMAFDCWCFDAAGTEPVPFDQDGYYYPTEDMTVYARWTPGYIVTFDANGYGFWHDMADTTYVDILKQGQPVGDISMPGVYDFEGVSWDGNWYLDSACTEENRVDNIYAYIPTGDVTFYVKWVLSRVVTLDANGGYFWNNPDAVTIQRNVREAESFDRWWYSSDLYNADQHLAFDGWYLDAACTEPVPFDQDGYYYPTEDMTIYAGWVEGWIVTFDANGYGFSGDMSNTLQTFTVARGDSIYSTPWTPPIEGVMFDGWYQDSACTEENRIDDIWSFVPDSDVTIYAKWVSAYIITLDANGGYFWNNPDVVTNQSAVREGESFERRWYKDALYNADQRLAFDGWYLDAACTEPVPFDQDGYYYPTEDMTIYAGWAEGWIVTWNANGGSVGGSQEILIRTIQKGNAVGYNWGIEKVGMAFAGWYTDPMFTEESRVDEIWNYVPISDVTFYAKWVSAYTITLNANGGYFWNDPDVVMDQSIFQEGERFSRWWYSGALYNADQHLVFDGWYLDAACTEPVPFDQDGYYYPTEDMTIYAGWAEDWIVTFDANGYGFSGDMSDTLQIFKVVRGDSIQSTPLTPFIEGVMFDGWYLDSACTEENRIDDIWSFVPDSDVTIYAKWVSAYIITLDANGGYFWNNPDAVTNQNIVREGESFERRWYSGDLCNADQRLVFDDWYLDAACTEPVSFDQDGRYYPTEDMTIYAGWVEGWIVTFDANGYGFSGDMSDTLQTFTVARGDSIYSTPWTPPIEGVMFDGWYLDSACREENRIDDIWSFVPDSDVTIYAKWVSAYIITLDANGGYFWNNPDAVTNQNIVREGEGFGRWWYSSDLYNADQRLVFDGWYLDAACTEPVPFDQEGYYYPTEDMTIYVGWAEGWIVTWNANGGSVGGSQEILIRTIQKGNAVGYDWSIEKDGMAFAGWYTDPMFTEESRVDEIWNYVPISDVTFYAKWVPAIVITTQPVDFVGAIGDMATFTLEAEGNGLSYQWQWFNGAVWADSGVSGNKTNTITTKITESKLDYQYRCVITDAAGNRLESNAVRMIEAQEEPTEVSDSMSELETVSDESEDVIKQSVEPEDESGKPADAIELPVEMEAVEPVTEEPEVNAPEIAESEPAEPECVEPGTGEQSMAEPETAESNS